MAGRRLAPHGRLGQWTFRAPPQVFTAAPRNEDVGGLDVLANDAAGVEVGEAVDELLCDCHNDGLWEGPVLYRLLREGPPIHVLDDKVRGGGLVGKSSRVAHDFAVTQVHQHKLFRNLPRALKLASSSSMDGKNDTFFTPALIN